MILETNHKNYSLQLKTNSGAYDVALRGFGDTIIYPNLMSVLWTFA